MKELFNDAERLFPQDQALVEEVKLSLLGRAKDFVGSLRRYPLQTQEDFFACYLERRYESCIDSRKGETLPRPNIEGAAKLMAEVNTIPLKDRELEMPKLRSDINSYLKLFSPSLPEKVTIKTITDLEKVELSMQSVISEWSTALIDLETGEEDVRSLKKAWNYASKIAENSGLYNYFNSIHDESYSYFPVAMSMVEAWLHGDGYKRGPYLDIPSFIPEFLYRRLTQALAWESISHLLSEKYSENPFKFLVKISRPGLWPIGWDGKKFLIARPKA